MYKQLLQTIGLTDTEAKIYLAAIELGQSLPKKLAEKAGVKRPTLYQALPELFEKGLLSKTIKGKRRYLVAEDPQNFIDNKKTALNQIEQAIPQLRSILATATTKPKIIFHEGYSGLKKVLMDNLNAKLPTLEFTGLAEMHTEMEAYFVNYYIPERINRRIKIKIIISGSEKQGEIHLTTNPETFREVKLINGNKFPLPLDCYIYGDNISFLVYRSDSEPIGVIIRSKEITVCMRSIFNFMWQAV